MTPVSSKTIPVPDGAKIEDWRWKRRLTVTELARKAGISRQYLNRIRNGHRGASLKVQTQIADALELPVEKIQRNAR